MYRRIYSHANSIRVMMMMMIYGRSMDQPGEVTNPARGQLNRENGYFPVRVRA